MVVSVSTSLVVNVDLALNVASRANTSSLAEFLVPDLLGPSESQLLPTPLVRQLLAPHPTALYPADLGVENQVPSKLFNLTSLRGRTAYAQRALSSDMASPTPLLRTAIVLRSNEYTRLISLGLRPVVGSRLLSLGVTQDGLSTAPYRSVAAIILRIGGLWGSAMTEVLALAIQMEQDPTYPVQRLPVDLHPRPTQISTFIDCQRLFTAVVFEGIEPSQYMSLMWAWWKELQPPARRYAFELSPDSPNPVAAGVDWSSLRVRGPMGFSLIIIGLLIIRIHVENLPHSTSNHSFYVDWCKLVLDVQAVLESALGFRACDIDALTRPLHVAPSLPPSHPRVAQAQGAKRQQRVNNRGTAANDTDLRPKKRIRTQQRSPRRL
jgi:hypothetical protein